MDISNWIAMGALAVGIAGSVFGLHKYYASRTESRFNRKANLLTTINEHSLKIATLNKEIIELRTTMKSIELKVDEKLQEFNRLNCEQHKEISTKLEDSIKLLSNIQGGIKAYEDTIQKLLAKRAKV